MVHGDDFVSVGTSASLQWFKARLQGRFEIKTKVIGSQAGQDREGRVLNRIVRVTDTGWEYEADPRHAELLIRGMRMEGANGVRSPGEDERPWAEEENGEPIRGTSATEYRALAARANYLAQDRADIYGRYEEVARSCEVFAFAPEIGVAFPFPGAWQQVVHVQ